MTVSSADENAGTGKGSARRLSAARLAAVQALYQMDAAATDVTDVITQFREYRLNSVIDDSGCQGADAAFFTDIVRGVVAGQWRIDPLLDARLAEGWRLFRIDSILRAILRSGAYELLERSDIPARVAINEYVDVAHAFFAGEEPKVVNGILDALARDIRAEEFRGTLNDH